tara:strand:+ start:214 stop:720 length:507 start_codon:yes stop_codon:yes gene_type:complete
MNVIPIHEPQPKDVTFFIGPIGAPPKFKEIYQNAVEKNDAGNTAPLDEILEAQIRTLREIAEDTELEPSPLKRLVGSLINSNIGTIPTFVSRGYMKKTWTPVITINLDQLTSSDGEPIGHLIQKQHGEVIAALLGKTFKAEWIYTSWVYPGTPIDISPSNHHHDVKED